MVPVANQLELEPSVGYLQQALLFLLFFPLGNGPLKDADLFLAGNCAKSAWVDSAD